MSRYTRRKGSRRAAVSVEFAVVAPIFLGIVLGVSQVSRLYDVQNMLAMATRDAARLAAMDREGVIPIGVPTNTKITNDIKNFMTASGLPANKATVKIADHDNPNTTLDLDNAANEFKLFDLTVELPYSSFSSLPVPEAQDFKIRSKIVFRNGRTSN